MKKIYSTLFLILASAVCAFSEVTVSPDNPHIVYNGRISWRNPKSPAFSYPGTSAEFRFTGSSVTMLAKPGSGYFMVELDSISPFKINFSESDSVITLASNLDGNEHRVRVTYAIEGYQKRPEFRGFLLSDGGKILSAPKRSARKIEFIGNSITCGYGIEADSAREKFTYDTENHYYTFAARTARALGAEYHVVARSGIGMYRNYGGPTEGTPDGCMPALYDRTLFYDAEEKWNFQQFQPDVVCVNLGTNDMSLNKGDSVRYENAALQFAKRLRGYYPHAKIVMLTGSMLTGKNLGIVQRSLDRVAAAMHENGDTGIYRFDMSPQDGSLGYGAGYHPSKRQAEKMAEELTSFLKSITTDMEIIEKDGFNLVRQSDGPDLGYSPTSGVKIIKVDGKAFKSFDGSDTLLPYEDWRLPMEERAADLASRLSIDEIAGLMLYSIQNKLPMPNDTYGGKPFAESGMKAYDLSDAQIKFLTDDNLRHVLVSTVESPETAARWNNKVQALVEGRTHGIPANNSSDPRHSAFADAEFSPGSDGSISLWSNMLGLAATFSPETVEEFARIASEEYRALGLATALSPQADLGTDPRWYRYSSTFGPEPQLVTDLTRAYADGFQTDYSAGGWGNGSVNAMVKHWPGGGSGEGGRDAHYGNGKFAVYPGGCYEQHKIPFLQGAFKLQGGTEKASAVMPYYTISYNQTNENVGNGFNREIITHQLREEAGYDGVVCTDWIITGDEEHPGIHSGKPWGVETMTVAERHYKALMAGVDQFGGNNEKGPVIEAYEMGVKEHGEKWMRERFERSARRLLLNIFRTGLFENPYVDVEHTKEVVGNPEFMRRGYEQQLKSVVMIKNHGNLLPQKECRRVYIPQRRAPEGPTYWRNITPERIYDPVPQKILEKYYDKAATAAEADFAVVFIESPHSLWMGYDMKEGYIPISLQYADYTATTARKHSIAGGDPFETSADRSYRGKTAHTINACDLTMLQQVRKEMGDKPVVVVLMMSNPTVMREIEPLADAILVGFDVQAQAYIDIISGRCEPSALLPVQLPESMEAVEEHCEDRPRDIRCYRDADGNVYDFAFGLNWSGVIDDERVKRYK